MVSSNAKRDDHIHAAFCACLALILQPVLGNVGLWFALLAFLAARGAGLASLLPTQLRKAFI